MCWWWLKIHATQDEYDNPNIKLIPKHESSGHKERASKSTKEVASNLLSVFSSKDEESKNHVKTGRDKVKSEDASDSVTLGEKRVPAKKLTSSSKQTSKKGVTVAKSSPASYGEEKKEVTAKSAPRTVSEGDGGDVINHVANAFMGLAKRGDAMMKMEDKSEELSENTKKFRSLSKKLKEKQAEKLSKSKIPW